MRKKCSKCISLINLTREKSRARYVQYGNAQNWVNFLSKSLILKVLFRRRFKTSIFAIKSNQINFQASDLSRLGSLVGSPTICSHWLTFGGGGSTGIVKLRAATWKHVLVRSTRQKFSQPSSCIALVYQSFCSRAIADRLYSDWIVQKNLVEYRRVP